MYLNKIGKLGEDIAVLFLLKKDFSIVERNYLRKGGEIDIIAKKADKYHFVEIKSVSREIIDSFPKKGEFIEPEENMHKFKIKRLINAISIYMVANKISQENFTFDLCVVYVDEKAKKAAVKFLEDLPLE